MSTVPRSWLSPDARRELRELRDLADAAEHSLWSRRVEAREALYRAAHSAVPQLLDEVERLERELAERDALRAEVERHLSVPIHDASPEQVGMRNCLLDSRMKVRAVLRGR